jgi:uracil phosphoribosyltransferase
MLSRLRTIQRVSKVIRQRKFISTTAAQNATVAAKSSKTASSSWYKKLQIIGTLGLATGVAASSDAIFADGEEKQMTYLDKMVKRLATLENMLGQSGFPSTTLLQSPAITSLLTVLRNKYSTNPVFVTYADRLCTILAEEGLARMNDIRPASVQTPCGRAEGLTTTRHNNLCVVSIVRSGDILSEAARRLAIGCSTGKILVQRDENDSLKRPTYFYHKLPKDIASKQVLLCDPMLATGGSAIAAIGKLIDAGVQEENILFLNVVSCPKGIMSVYKKYPKVRIVTAAIDKELNSEKFIVPGLGDFGDRYYGTE